MRKYITIRFRKKERALKFIAELKRNGIKGARLVEISEVKFERFYE